MDPTCPKDAKHHSTDPLYCSVCGAKIVPTIIAPNTQSSDVTPAKREEPKRDRHTPTVLTPMPAMKSLECPDCSTEYTNLELGYCEVCRFIFDPKKAHSKFKSTLDLGDRYRAVNPAVKELVDEQSAGSSGAQRADDPATQRWEILIVVDPSLYRHPDAASACPVEPEKIFHLDTQELLIGRKSESKKIYPDVSLNDPGISHRHFKLLKDKDNNIQLLDVGSSNGTMLNEAPIAAGIKKNLREGDQITLGCWTRITVQRKSLE